jgi:stearoyl-CoA desaturase (delta-9 desaturase)
MILAIPILGDGWHNNHHAFPGAAIVQFEWWQLDPSGWLIRALERFRLAWDVNGMSPAARLQAKRLPSARERSAAVSTQEHV